MKGYLGEKYIYDVLSKYPAIRKYGISWQGKQKSLSYKEWKSLNGRHDSKDRPDLMVGDMIAIESKNTSAVIRREWLGDWYDRFNDVYFTDNKIIVTPDDTKYTSFANIGIRFERRVSDICIVTRSRLLRYVKNTLQKYNKHLAYLKKSFKRIKSLTFNVLETTYVKHLVSIIKNSILDHTTALVKKWYNVFIQHCTIS